MKLAIVKKLSPMVDKAKVILNKKSPEIWLGAGVIAIIGGTIWACHASRKLDEIMDERDYRIQDLEDQKEADELVMKEVKEKGELLTADDLYFKTPSEYKKQRAIVTFQCAGDLVKAYAPAIILIGGGIGAVIQGHRILNKRNAALLSAYMTLDDSFTKYRNRVATRFGQEVENELYSGRSYETITTTVKDENGKKKKMTEQVPVVTEGVSPYVMFYDKQTSSEWNASATFNHTFLIAQQNAANDLFRIRSCTMRRKGKRGWLFLNEVLEMLGIEPTPTGAVCGWLSPLEGEDPIGDDYIDFGIVEANEDGSIMLDFNCQGMIYDKI